LEPDALQRQLDFDVVTVVVNLPALSQTKSASHRSRMTRCSEPDKIARPSAGATASSATTGWAFSLDSAGTGQNFVPSDRDPNGVQMDALNTASFRRAYGKPTWSGTARAGLTDDGYNVRNQACRCKASGSKAAMTWKMGILFWRRISREGVVLLLAGYSRRAMGLSIGSAHLVFPELKQPQLIRVLPSVTYSVNQLRATPNNWNSASGKSDVGLQRENTESTSSITLDATINPTSAK